VILNELALQYRYSRHRPPPSAAEVRQGEGSHIMLQMNARIGRKGRRRVALAGCLIGYKHRLVGFA
jgi:hypothetical protein